MVAIVSVGLKLFWPFFAANAPLSHGNFFLGVWGSILLLDPAPPANTNIRNKNSGLKTKLNRLEIKRSLFFVFPPQDEGAKLFPKKSGSQAMDKEAGEAQTVATDAATAGGTASEEAEEQFAK